jgi:hypothetical protein
VEGSGHRDRCRDRHHRRGETAQPDGLGDPQPPYELVLSTKRLHAITIACREELPVTAQAGVARSRGSTSAATICHCLVEEHLLVQHIGHHRGVEPSAKELEQPSFRARIAVQLHDVPQLHPKASHVCISSLNGSLSSLGLETLPIPSSLSATSCTSGDVAPPHNLFILRTAIALGSRCRAP